MLKEQENKYKYVKFDEDFFDSVFMAGSNNEYFVNSIDEQQVVLCGLNASSSPTFLVANDYELINVINKLINPQFTVIFQKGMVKALKAVSPERAKQYISDLVQFEKEKITDHSQMLKLLLEEE